MNIAQTIPAAASADFIDELAELLVPWGVPATAGRLYGFLMLNQKPVTLDQIAESLEMSRAGAWNAAKFLEQSGNAKRLSERGSKRVYFRIANEMAPCLLDRLKALGDVGRLLQTSGVAVAEGEARDRMVQIAENCIRIEQFVLSTEGEQPRSTDGGDLTG